MWITPEHQRGTLEEEECKDKSFKLETRTFNASIADRQDTSPEIALKDNDPMPTSSILTRTLIHLVSLEKRSGLLPLAQAASINSRLNLTP